MTAPQSKDTAGSERAIREALAAFPKGWHTVFQEVRERNPGVVEIGALWEDSDSLAEVVTVDTGNYYDNASAMPVGKFIAACNPEAIASLFAELDRLRASQPSGAAGGEVNVAGIVAEASAKTAHYDALAALARNRRMVLEEIAGSKPLTATPQQFADHLQRLARKAIEDYTFAGNDDDRASLASPSSGGWRHRFAQTYCSECGGQFGPGDSGYSHCEDHPAPKSSGESHE